MQRCEDVTGGAKLAVARTAFRLHDSPPIDMVVGNLMEMGLHAWLKVLYQAYGRSAGA